MSDKIQNSLSSFMKKQINEKSSKSSVGKSGLFSGESKGDENKDEDKKEKTEEELEQEKALEEAKKASRNKMAGKDQSAMYKKMILENTLKYGLVMICFGLLAFGLMKFGPIAAKFFGGLIHNLVMGVFKK